MGQFGKGQGIRRVEDQRFLTGHARYTDDIRLAGESYMAVVRSPLAHAEITAIDIAEARDLPGVLLVLTAEDLASEKIGNIPVLAKIQGRDGEVKQPPHPVLARRFVRHVGDPVAVVVAETYEQAVAAAETVVVDYDDRPAVTDAAAALAAQAPQVHPEAPGNLALTWEHGDRAAVEAAFAKAERRARIEIINNRLVVNSMEPRVALGEYDPASEHFTLTTPSQGIFRLHDQLAETILGTTKDKVRIVTPDVGGGFGMKIFCYAEQVLVLLAARRLGRPVRWVGERTESFQSDIQGRDHRTVAEMAMDKDGRFLGIRVETKANLGAYLSNFGPYIPTGASTQMYSGLYKIPAIFAEVQCAFTNTVPVDAYRGAGRPEAAYCMERLVEACAREIGVDTREIRLRNFIRPEDLPYETGMGPVYDSGDPARLLEQATKLADWEGVAERKAEARRRGKYRGIGLASYVEACGGIGAEEARISLEEDGGVTLVIGTMTNGQGHHTAYAQILNDLMDIDPEKVRLVQGDSDIVKRGGGTGGSRSLLMGGVATERAGEKVIERARKVAGHLLEAADADLEFADGLFTIAGTDKRVTLTEVAKATHGEDLPEEIAGPIEETGGYKAEAMTYPNGCHIVELEIDDATGTVEILRYVVVDDFGKVVNPLLVLGQVHGGTAQGIGQALLEHTVYDEDGQLITASFMDYTMPRADDTPNFEITLVEDMPCATNPLGVKGAGEAGAIGAPPAIINALLDALQPLGVAHLDMPATPERIWRAMRDADSAQRRAAE
ncbi:xanthine dehydrogenase family protein molybdopterin-binding subunit [Algihabitans albus]|uniref:xanthine dehydrogenase family protein molybdopterin-binding subunit n=1 Tax=Algihabitans albus TaxID=2164067 RepID=UPI000E5C7CDE|nr:xanthine dehydrogenase family protein molybdopterin-binding subunit [Algihabitans albus]